MSVCVVSLLSLSTMVIKMLYLWSSNCVAILFVNCCIGRYSIYSFLGLLHWSPRACGLLLFLLALLVLVLSSTFQCADDFNNCIFSQSGHLRPTHRPSTSDQENLDPDTTFSSLALLPLDPSRASPPSVSNSPRTSNHTCLASCCSCIIQSPSRCLSVRCVVPGSWEQGFSFV